ncbi:MAG: cob(I)yrinic acid a,c-diamide adenosyltransferase [Bacteroidales bacterium]|nr:cob(I)yrinic acid a,c-diamide adenosyltransferase [Bacteroidales bacterium]
MKIYTKTGDAGTTALIGNKRVSKNDARVEAYGAVDELNAFLGLVRTFNLPGQVEDMILRIQKNLFSVSSFMACTSPEIAAKFGEPDTEIVAAMEQAVDEMMKKLPETFSFSIPAKNPLSANVNIARTVCRRAERNTVAVKDSFPHREYVLQFLNRLADYLYALYRILDE